ncbi:hypothetical protein TNCV_4812601 [Trichonephila clavipes]|nr:hypothetical protein TNCV_4812601 [Trichonephila clavipes]
MKEGMSFCTLLGGSLWPFGRPSAMTVAHSEVKVLEFQPQAAPPTMEPNEGMLKHDTSVQTCLSVANPDLHAHNAYPVQTTAFDAWLVNEAYRSA